MKRIILTTLLAMLLLASTGHASVFTVPSEPLWTNSGILLNPGDSVSIHGAAGTWTWAAWSGLFFGPEGNTQPTLTYDEWITNGQHGQLIGYIGTLDLNTYPRLLSQNNQSLFSIGTGSIVAGNTGGSAGYLWFGFNDDYTTNVTNDNIGSVNVSVDTLSAPVPEPSTILVLGLGLIGVAAFRKNTKA